MEDKELISVGRITGTHGYQGVVRVSPLTDFPERFDQLKEVILDTGRVREKASIESCKQYKQQQLIKFTQIDNLEAARQYRGALLKIPSEQVYPLPEGYYYHFQLQGMKVEDIELGFLGDLQEILETGANDVYVISSREYGELLIPAIKEVVLNVDLELNCMQVSLLPGLIPGKKQPQEEK